MTTVRSVVSRETIIMGASEVYMPNGKTLYFLTAGPGGNREDDNNPTERHGITFREYRCPQRFFYAAIETGFPFLAELELTNYDGKIKVTAFKVIRRIE